MSIRFGTSGWRAVIADEFTYLNVQRVTQAICSYLKTSSEDSKGKLVIGRDTRFMGEKFADLAARIASDMGIEVLLSAEPTPTPALSFAIRDSGAGGGINFTASHNPPEYQGIKFSTSNGAPALPEVTKQIEDAIHAGTTDHRHQGGSVTDFDACTPYLADLRSKIRMNVIEAAGGRYAYDPLWGTGRGYLDRLLSESGLEVKTLHDWRDVTFGGRAPEPSEGNIPELREIVTSEDFILGIATDGDGDRFGVIDSNGKYIAPNQLVALLTDYLAESRGWTDGVGRSVATSHLIDRVAEKRGLPVHETPVGFKYLGELIDKGEIIIGAEESAGLSIKGHYPEKDGLLACLLAVEAVAARGVGLTEQLDHLYEEVGRLESGRIGVKLTPDVAAKLKEKLAVDPTDIGGRRIESINRMDGVKFLFANNAWILMRPSGTEPLVRIYAESEDMNDLEDLLEQGRKYLLG